MAKRMIIMLFAVILVLGGIFGYRIFVNSMIAKFMAAGANPVMTVSATKADKMEWQPLLEAVGSLKAVKGSDLSAEVSGIVDSINFESDSDVKEGDLLLQLRSDEDRAHLQSLEATAKLAEATYERSLKQQQSQAISKAAVEADEAALASAKAQVLQQRAAIAKKSIRAPFDGHVGIRAVDVGQYLNPGTMITSIQQLDPIYVDFSLPEQSLSLVNVGQKVIVKTDARAGVAFEGEVSAVNRKIEVDTRNVQVRATLKNTEHLLLPGMFASVKVEAGQVESRLTLPQTAITYNPYGNTVYVLEDKGAGPNGEKEYTAKQAFVTTGETRGDQVVILSGIKEGDSVVTSGQMKLRSSSTVVINNDVEPLSDANPKPKDQ